MEQETVDDDGRYSVQTDGVINHVEVEIRCVAFPEEEHLAELIHQDLVSRADEINQIVELDIHPEATTPTNRIGWEGWQNGEYEGIKEGD